jgi:hypothetical protein
VFMTGDFKEFKAEDQVGSSWNQNHAVAKTAVRIRQLIYLI